MHMEGPCLDCFSALPQNAKTGSAPYAAWLGELEAREVHNAKAIRRGIGRSMMIRGRFISLAAIATMLLVGGCATVPSTFASSHRLIVSINDGKRPSFVGTYIGDPSAVDTLTAIDASIFPAEVIAHVEVQSSVTMQPPALALSPDEKLALVSSAKSLDGTGGRRVEERFIQVIDLEASPPRTVDHVELVSSAVGVSFNRTGDLALAAHPDGHVSVLAVNAKSVRRVATLELGGTTSHVSQVDFLPDGKWALAIKKNDGAVAVLKVDGSQVRDTGRDVVFGVEVYGLAVFPDGKAAAVAVRGAESEDDGKITFIDLTRQPFRAVRHVSVGRRPEGIAISPDGKWMVVVCINGAHLPKATRPVPTKDSTLMLFAIRDGTATKVNELPVDTHAQGVTFTPDANYVLVQNYAGRHLAEYQVTPAGLEDTGVRLIMPGNPVSIKMAPW